MNVNERKTMLICMDYIARHINDEEIFYDCWLIDGVPDGAIPEDKTEKALTDMCDIYVEDFYVENHDCFQSIMGCFLKCMKLASRNGGLYCNGVVDSFSETE